MMRRYHPSKLGLLALSFTLVVSSGLVWAMGSRVPAVGTAAEDFRLVDLEGKSQSLEPISGQGRACEFLGDLVQALHDGNARDAGHV